MLFAKIRWTGKVLHGADIERNSKTWRELSSTLITFSKYLKEKNRRGDGANRIRLDLSPECIPSNDMRPIRAKS